MSRIRDEIAAMPPFAVCAQLGFEYCTIDEAAARLGVSRRRVRELIEQCRLGTPRQRWGRIFVPVGLVERFERRKPGRKSHFAETR
jgi:excisionase family DNA binding protein